MSLPDPGTPDLKRTEGSSWPTYSSEGLSKVSAHSEERLWQSGSWYTEEALAELGVATWRLADAAIGEMGVARLRRLAVPRARKSGRFTGFTFVAL
jgi:hypothetical protein